MEFMEHVQGIVSDFGEHMPHDHRVQDVLVDGQKIRRVENTVYIPAGLFRSISAVMKEFKELTGSTIAERTAYRIWEEHFFYVRIKRWIPFAKCDLCVELRERLLLCKDEDKRVELRAVQAEHRLAISSYRKQYTDRKTRATHPASRDVHLSMILDAFDSSKTNTPQLRSSLSKGRQQAGDPIKSRMVGVLVHGRAFFGAWTLPVFEQGGNLTCTILLQVLGKLLAAESKLPPILYLQMDNCGRENKNNVVLHFLGYLVHLRVFTEIYVHFLPVGHTHEDIDQHFSVLHRHLRDANLLTLSQVMEAAAQCHTGTYPLVDHWIVGEQVDFRAALSPQAVHAFKGLGTSKIAGKKRSLHAMRIALDESGAPCMQWKEFDSKDSPWLGHWQSNAPVPIFKDVEAVGTEFVSVPRRQLDGLDEIKKLYAALRPSWECILQDAADVAPQSPSTAQAPANAAATTTSQPVQVSTSAAFGMGGVQDAALRRELAKVQDAVPWWDELLREEDAFGAAHEDAPSVRVTELSWPAYKQPLDFDVLAVDAATLQSGLPASTQRSEQHVFYVGHAAEAPHTTARFNATEDVEVGAAALVRMEPTPENQNKRWAIGEVVEVDLASNTVEVKWLMPRPASSKRRCEQAEVDMRWLHAEGWDNDVLELGAVQWVFPLTKFGYVFKRNRRVLQHEIERLEGAHEVASLPAPDTLGDDDDV